MDAFFDLFYNVAEEGVIGPAQYHHDGEGGNSGKIHGRSIARYDGVGTNVGRLETQSILSQKLYGGAKLGVYGGGGDGIEVAIYEDGVDGGVFICSWEGKELVYYCCPPPP